MIQNQDTRLRIIQERKTAYYDPEKPFVSSRELSEILNEETYLKPVVDSLKKTPEYRIVEENNIKRHAAGSFFLGGCILELLGVGYFWLKTEQEIRNQASKIN